MPKSILIEPQEVLSSGTIHFSDIPVNAYQRTMAEELKVYSVADLLHIWQDMCAIREFETILQRDQNQGRVPGLLLSARRSGAPFHRPGSGGRGHGLFAHSRRPYLRLAPQPRRDSGQGIFGHSPVER